MYKISISLDAAGTLVNLYLSNDESRRTWKCSFFIGHSDPLVDITRAPHSELTLGPIDRIRDVGLEAESDMEYRRSVRATWSLRFLYSSPHDDVDLFFSKVTFHTRVVKRRHWNLVLVPFLRRYVLPACDFWRLSPEDVERGTRALRRVRRRDFHRMLGLALSSDVIWARSEAETVSGWLDDFDLVEETDPVRLRRVRQLALRSYRRICQRRPSSRRCSAAITRLFSLPPPPNH